jgi:hypothetical protein
MRSSLAVIVTTFVAATAAQSNYTLPAGFNIGLVTPATLGECIEKVEVDGLPCSHPTRPITCRGEDG